MTIRECITEQPAVIDRVFREFPKVLAVLEAQPLPSSIWLVGSGTSKNALYAIRPLFERLLGIPARVEGPLSFARQAQDGTGQLAIVVSQTGTSTTSVNAVVQAQGLGFRTLALTGEADSPFAKVARIPLVMPIGPEPVGPKTKGYTGSFAALAVLAYSLAGKQAPVTPDIGRFAAVVAASEQAVRPLASIEVDQVMILGQGRHNGTALEAALKVAEIAGVAAAAFDIEEALHGRFHGLSAHSLAVFVTADTTELQMAETATGYLKELGIASRIVDLSGAGTPAYRFDLGPVEQTTLADYDVLWAILPFQWLAVLLAEARGMRPEDMRYPGMSEKLRIKTVPPT